VFPYDAALQFEEITNWFVDHHQTDYERKNPTKWIGAPNRPEAARAQTQTT